MLKIEDVLEILSIPLLGIIPESEEVLRASNLGSPVTLNNARARRRGPTSTPPGGSRARTLAMISTERQKGLLQQAVRTEGGMNLLRTFSLRRGSAPVARERLQILLAHERAAARASPTSSRSCARRSSP